jgi:hypothetical protein
MENEGDILQEINENIVFLSEEYKEKKSDLDAVK